MKFPNFTFFLHSPLGIWVSKDLQRREDLFIPHILYMRIVLPLHSISGFECGAQKSLLSVYYAGLGVDGFAEVNCLLLLKKHLIETPQSPPSILCDKSSLTFPTMLSSVCLVRHKYLCLIVNSPVCPFSIPFLASLDVK